MFCSPGTVFFSPCRGSVGGKNAYKFGGGKEARSHSVCCLVIVP